MPIYEYRCSSCGYQNDFLQKISEPQLTDCPECGKSTFAKQVTAAGFQLKGTGWYATDFKNNGKSKSGGKKEESGNKEASGNKEESGKKAESKSATSTDSAGSGDSGAKSDAPASGAGAGASPPASS